jgi:hypothetical protein
MATKGLTLLALLLLLGACRQIPADTVPDRHGDLELYQALKADAAALFSAVPRLPDSVLEAAAKLEQATELRADDPEGLLLGARIAAWIGGYHPDETRREEHIRRGLAYANTALEQQPESPEATYWHAVLAGYLGELSRAYGLDAMRTIERAMQQLIAAGHNLDHGGPWRVYGTLQMRAPGPPTGVGSMRNAGRNLRAAVEAAPDWPENHLYLAEWEMLEGRARDNAELVAQGVQRLHDHLLNDNAAAPPGYTTEFGHWQAKAQGLLPE